MKLVSSRALYEMVGKSLGMTPAAYRRGGDGLHIRYWATSAMLGRVLVANTERGICTVLLGQTNHVLLQEVRAEFPKAVFEDHAPSSEWLARVKSCEREDPLISKLPRELREHIFQARIWGSVR
jgi:AraC family transcriptional regulator of adaptative response/methylated-DNA-[protein]-cysteine methyltransferase